MASARAGSASLEASVETMLSTLRANEQQSESQTFTIFRVPSYIRDSNRTAYEPRMVSIGPYYHSSPDLRAMEDHKWRYLQDLLSRNITLSAATLIEEMRSLETRARACYSERPLLDSDEFIRMLLLDGCFIIEFFFKWHTQAPDALCDVGWGLTLINTDLLLLENQIPFFVIERLYCAVMGTQGGRESLLNLLLQYIGNEEPIACPSATSEIHHLLHLYYDNFVPKRSPIRRTKMVATAPPGIPCAKKISKALVTIMRQKKTKVARGIPRATEMRAAGVSFVRRKKKKSEETPAGGQQCTKQEEMSLAQDIYDVKFDAKRGVMEIPAVVVDDMVMRPLLVNLVAFEQTKGAEESLVVTSYVSLMSLIIRGKDDVELLRQSDILDNLLADDDEAAKFFSHLGDGAAMNYDMQVFTDLYENVRVYCGSWWHRSRAALVSDYFGSPWSAIAVVGAAFGLALTAIQTYFTVFPVQN